MAGKKKYATKKKVAKKKIVKAGVVEGAALKGKQKVTVEVDLEPIAGTGAAKKNPAKYQKLRFEAAVLYVTTLEPITLQDLHKDPRFSALTYGTLQKWSKDDKWNERRKQMFLNVQKKLEDKLGEQLEDALVKEVQDLISLRDKAVSLTMKTLEGTDLPLIAPRSWEGVSKILMESNARINDIRKEVAGGIATSAGSDPISSGDGRHPAAKIQYDGGELRGAANYILAQRRKKRTATPTEEPTPLTAEEKGTAMKLVSGGEN